MMRHLVWIITPLLCSLKGAELNLEFCHQWDNEPITLEDSQHSANGNVQCSLSRIAYLISELVGRCIARTERVAVYDQLII